MIKGFKIRLIPTREQEKLMFKSIGCSRFTWNWALNKSKEMYEQGKKYSMGEIRKEFTQLKKQLEDIAKEQNRSFNNLVITILKNFVSDTQS